MSGLVLPSGVRSPEKPYRVVGVDIRICLATEDGAAAHKEIRVDIPFEESDKDSTAWIAKVRTHLRSNNRRFDAANARRAQAN